MASDQVRIWEERVEIPTYGVGRPDRNPMFLEKRVYQGSSGVVYPFPVIDQLTDRKEPKAYAAVWLENRYLKIMVLPEQGGRIQMALDKTNNYHFIYYNRVIKPALVGLCGPWISGGIEFNWPQHHRPSTYLPVQHVITEAPDGSKTLWLAEIDRMYGTRALTGLRLHPDRAYLEIDVRLYNGTTEPQTFLWWANPAVAVDEHHQTLFPPDVTAVFDHGKRDVSAFPIGNGTYYQVDFRGVDISRYANIPVPMSYMAHRSKYDFIASYDHGRRAGLLHVANHHVSPGKKQWTWGHGDFGQAWDRELTDADGPYVEMMTGVYTDNQPDFSWLAPFEAKAFTQYFMPFKELDGLKNATRDAAINLDVQGAVARVGAYVTSPRERVTLRLLAAGRAVFEQTMALTPERAFQQEVHLPTGVQLAELRLTLLDADGRELVSYAPERVEAALPEPAPPARRPAEIASNEELFLLGLHIEQYRHALFAAEPYYREALRRDPGDARCNNALGLLLYRRGRFADAEGHFRAAIARLTWRNPNPYDSEPYYNLGLVLVAQRRYDEAFAAFYKATWSGAWQAAAYFELARIACRQQREAEALDLVQRSLVRNAHHLKARHLQTALLRLLGRTEEAERVARASLELDPLDFGAHYELQLLVQTRPGELDRIMLDQSHNYLELAGDYARAGLYAAAVAVLARCVERSAPNLDPLIGYQLGEYCQQMGSPDAATWFARAAAAVPDYCFPNRLDSLLALQTAVRLNPTDSKAHYYLGNFWYSRREHDRAIAAWEESRRLHDDFATVHRNLGLAYYNQRGDGAAALADYERAFALDSSDARVLYELDQLRKRIGHAAPERLALLERHLALVKQRDDLYIEYVTLLNQLRRHGQALELLLARRFHPWEGGEGKVTGQYALSLTQLARNELDGPHPERAIEHLSRAQRYPENLGEGKLAGARENDIFYLLGCAYEAMRQPADARAAFERASTGLHEPKSAQYYNDQPPDMIYFQGLALRKLGREAEATERFRRLCEYGQAHLNDTVEFDFFAVSLPDFLVFDDDLGRRNRIHCHYMTALGWLGLGATDQARTSFDAVLALDANHLGALFHRPR